jgi:hypothetical protein
MPLWLRRTTFNLINEHFKQQQEAADAQQSMLKNTGKNEISRPNISSQPDYTAKVPTKK